MASQRKIKAVFIIGDLLKRRHCTQSCEIQAPETDTYKQQDCEQACQDLKKTLFYSSNILPDEVSIRLRG